MESSVREIDTLVQSASRLRLFSDRTVHSLGLRQPLKHFSCLCISISSPLILKDVKSDKTKSIASVALAKGGDDIRHHNCQENLNIFYKLTKNCCRVLIIGTAVSLCVYIGSSLHRHLTAEHR